MNPDSRRDGWKAGGETEIGSGVFQIAGNTDNFSDPIFERIVDNLRQIMLESARSEVRMSVR